MQPLRFVNREAVPMRYVTRFVPTTNGDLHLGHLYTVLFNYYAAHKSGGVMLVRFEDNGIDTLADIGAMQSQYFTRRQREALEWIGVPVNDWRTQSEMDMELRQYIGQTVRWQPEFRFPYSLPLDAAQGQYNPEQGEWYGYTPFNTYHKVIYDELMAVNLLIRGEDLRSEFSLYQHYRAMLGLPTILHYYLPRLRTAENGAVSKFHHARSILEYKQAGWTPRDIVGLLSECCLQEPGKGWQLSNVKRYPRLDKKFCF